MIIILLFIYFWQDFYFDIFITIKHILSEITFLLCGKITLFDD